MAWRVIVTILVFLMLVFGFGLAFQNLPGKSVELKVNYLDPESLKIIDYGAVPVFSENLRFNHNLISYSIGGGCDVSKRNDMAAAFNIFSEEVKIVSFYEKIRDADIRIECSDEHIELGGNLFAAGEGGPSRIINTSGFKVIEEGRIILYSENNCDYPIVALHELGHVFGFDHSPDPGNIMFNISGCDQRMSNDMADVIVELYSVEALSDAKIKSLDGVIKGQYLSFNISILNEGMIGIDAINLTIVADGDVVEVADLGEIELGYGRTLKVENMKVPRNIDVLEFIVDRENSVRELDEDNNVAEMVSEK